MTARGDLNRLPCSCWVRGCSEVHERALLDAVTARGPGARRDAGLWLVGYLRGLNHDDACNGWTAGGYDCTCGLARAITVADDLRAHLTEAASADAPEAPVERGETPHKAQHDAPMMPGHEHAGLDQDAFVDRWKGLIPADKADAFESDLYDVVLRCVEEGYCDATPLTGGDATEAPATGGAGTEGDHE